VLAEELGVAPSPQTEAAFLALLGDEPAVVSGAPPVPLPAALLDLPGGFVVGRQTESERLGDALKRTEAEGRQAVFVGGEPGIGKSTLVAAFARNAHHQGARVLYGRCDEELGLSYQPFAEALSGFIAHAPLNELAAHVAAHGG
jgi:Mrp family chromosome partitioning ATPase